MATNGTKPPGSAEKGLGEIVSDISSKVVLLVKQEIELLKVELSTKFSRIAKGAVFFAIAAVLALFMLIWLFHFLALGIADWTGLKPYVGYAIVTFLLFVGVVILGLLGYRSVKKGTPPTPELSIEEAKKTVAVLEEARH
jgi:uncharacterized membrane protein YqjE